MNQIELAERFANMWRQSRERAGKSQDYMAKALGVSKTTIQNWEAGTSCPNQLKGFEWFQALGLQALPYYLELFYPSESGDISSEEDEKIEEALIQYAKALRPSERKKLLFVVYGQHGSEFEELIELMVAYFHTPDENRITVAQNICTNFEIAEATGTTVAKDGIMPDLKLVKNAIIRKRNKILRTNVEEYK